MRCKLGDISEITKLAGYEFTKYIKYIPDGEIIAVRALNLKNGALVLDDIQRIQKKYRRHFQEVNSTKMILFFRILEHLVNVRKFEKMVNIIWLLMCVK